MSPVSGKRVNINICVTGVRKARNGKEVWNGIGPSGTRGSDTNITLMYDGGVTVEQNSVCNIFNSWEV